MKNATKHQNKIKKFLTGIGKSVAPPAPGADSARVMIEAILAADAPKLSGKAMEALEKEFVDYNELRVAPAKDIVDTLGRDFPEARRKAEEIATVLNAVFSRRNDIALDYVEKMSKRDLRRHLAEIGLSPYAAGILMLQVFGGHAIPVDQGLVDCLEADEYIEPGSTIEDVQAFLERIILQKQAWAAHEFFRDYVGKNAKMLAKRRKTEAAKADAADAKVEADAMAEWKVEEPAKPAAAPAAKPEQPQAPAKPGRTSRKKAGVKTSSKSAASPKAASPSAKDKKPSKPAKPSRKAK